MRTKASVHICLTGRGKHGHDTDPDQMHANRASARGRPMTATQDDTIAELQRTIAELRRERDAAQTRRNSEYGERIEHQSATIDVLKVMSASPGDPQPVFDLIVRRAQDCATARRPGFTNMTAHWSTYDRTTAPGTIAGAATISQHSP